MGTLALSLSSSKFCEAGSGHRYLKFTQFLLRILERNVVTVKEYKCHKTEEPTTLKTHEATKMFLCFSSFPVAKKPNHKLSWRRWFKTIRCFRSSEFVGHVKKIKQGACTLAHNHQLTLLVI